MDTKNESTLPNSVTVSGDWVQGDKVGGNKTVVEGSHHVIIGDNNRQTISSGIAGKELAVLFTPILEAIASVEANKRAEAERIAQELQSEAAKGEDANDARTAKLIDGLVALVPTAVSSVAAAFASPILAAVTGPVTKFVLDKIQGK